MDILVTYDVVTSDPTGQRRLERVAKVCEGYGSRVQYSVFECRLSAAKYVLLIADLRGVMDPRLDSINVYRFDGSVSNARLSLGQRVVHEPGEPWIL